MDLYKELRDHRPDVQAARWAIWIVLIIGFGSGFAVANYWRSEQVSILRERVAQLEESRSPSQLRIKEVTSGTSYRVQANDDVVQVNNAENISTTILLPSGFIRESLSQSKTKKATRMHSPSRLFRKRTIDKLRELAIVVNRGSFSLIWDGDTWSMN